MFVSRLIPERLASPLFTTSHDLEYKSLFKEGIGVAPLIEQALKGRVFK